MANAKEELVEQIEKIRKKMDQCIEQREEYRKIYRYSVELDQLLNQYIVAGYYRAGAADMAAPVFCLYRKRLRAVLQVLIYIIFLKNALLFFCVCTSIIT